MLDTAENKQVILLDAEDLEELVAEGMAAEFQSKEHHGTITILGLERVVRHGRGLSIVEMHASGSIHRGFLVPNQITSGSVIRVKNSGGRHESPVVGSRLPRLTGGDQFRANFRWSQTLRSKKW